ncbi:glucosaminidase domain-containing protein [Mariprofundus sp. KV]|uniref:glucosaminidase domain-containing protein n=1 Tax=Mariprofundus sp. KV TaxID=2608715 RepID=UPI0015A26CD7|nr:glucosaminidase domain-containing protein [Mariprofundus sp. KV]NWF35933.1 hypothetical protein [Mariprofundus sp. KV]
MHKLLTLMLPLLLLSGCGQEGITGVHLNETYVVTLPDFASYSDVKEKKRAFFDFLRPIIEQENSKVMLDRKRMLALEAILKERGGFSPTDASWLKQLAENYRVEMPSFDDEQAWTLLKRRVDTVPFRLALAQAANESSWGTSRFAREGLNLFGQWCFTQGCGIVPSHRAPDMTHEVATYASVNASVAAYIHSINRVQMYTPLRKLRRSIRKRGDKPTAIELAQELSGYSERGEAYVSEIQSMIRTNYNLMSPPDLASQDGERRI